MRFKFGIKSDIKFQIISVSVSVSDSRFKCGSFSFSLTFKFGIKSDIKFQLILVSVSVSVSDSSVAVN